MLGKNNKYVFEREIKKFIREKLFLSKNAYNYRRSLIRIKSNSTSKPWFKEKIVQFYINPHIRFSLSMWDSKFGS
jgi:hypothetical protein